MSLEDYLRRTTQEQLRNNPHTQHVQPHQADYWTRTTINNEMNRIRKEEDERRRQGRS